MAETKTKPVRVWVHVYKNGRPDLISVSESRQEAVELLSDGARECGITIRRATLTVAPVPTRKRRAK